MARKTHGSSDHGRLGRWVTRKEAAAAMGVAERTVDRRRKDLNPSGDLSVRRYAGGIRIWIPASYERSPEARLRAAEEKLLQVQRHSQVVTMQLRQLRAMFVKLHASVYGDEQDIEGWLDNRLRRKKRGSRGRGRRRPRDRSMSPSQ